MILRRLSKALVFACLISLATTSGVYAHALPGSRLIFSHQDAQLNLTLSLSVEDLVLAASEFESLENLDPGDALTPDQMRNLSAYFSNHMRLTQDTVHIPLELTHAALQTSRHEDVGTFVVIETKFRADFNLREDIFPLTLIYDAVMHEVRNHRATIYWKAREKPLNRLGDFGIYRNNFELLKP